MTSFDRDKNSPLYDTITIRLSKESGLKDIILAHAKAGNESAQEFIVRSITEQILRDNNLCATCMSIFDEQ